jgi:hypothetical protein
MKKPRLEVVATVTIVRPADMTPLGRKQIAQWLRGRAALLIKHGDLMAPKFTARYYVPKAKKGKKK